MIEQKPFRRVAFMFVAALCVVTTTGCTVTQAVVDGLFLGISTTVSDAVNTVLMTGLMP